MQTWRSDPLATDGHPPLFSERATVDDLIPFLILLVGLLRLAFMTIVFHSLFGRK